MPRVDIREFQEQARRAQWYSLVPLLPALLRLKGKPYSLGRHYPFEPFFNTLMPRRSLLKAGRQVGKCVDEDERIRTPEGWRRAGDLKVGDRVLAWDGIYQQPRKIKTVWKTGAKLGLRITAGVGQSRVRVVVSFDHQMWTRPAKGVFSRVLEDDRPRWTRACDITLFDEVAYANVDSERIEWRPVVDVGETGLRQMVDFEVEEDHNFFLRGLIVHNSASFAAKSIVTTAAIAYFNTLHVTPLFEQVKRFSHQYVGPFINSSPVQRLLVDTRSSNSVLQRSYRNGATQYFSFAYLDAERVRGIPADRICYDEIQGFNYDFIPIIRSTTDGSEWRISEYSGTPLTLDNTMEKLWTDSSQAEYCIKCHHGGCGHINIPSLGYDLVAMIGPYHDGIGPDCAGVVCAKCRKPLIPAPPHARWWHAHESRVHDFPGYHLPQIIMPIHAFDRERWKTVVRRMMGQENTKPHQFFNEVCGESYDTGTKLVSLTELRRAACLPWPRVAEEAKRHISGYVRRCVAVDWGGALDDGTYSYTVVSVLGLTLENEVHVLWAYRVNRIQDYDFETELILSVCRNFQAHYIVHDANGQGYRAEAALVKKGVPIDRFMPMIYGGVLKAGFMAFKPARPAQPRSHYLIDKSRALAITCEAVRRKVIKFFQWDDKPDEPGLILDFLSLREEVTERPNSFNLYKIVRNPNQSDDFVHTVCYGACSFWYPNNWPDFSRPVSDIFAVADAHAYTDADVDEQVTIADWFEGSEQLGNDV